MNDERLIKNIKILIIFFSICFFSIIGYLTYFNIFVSPSVVMDSSNPRIKLSENEVLRGSILDRNGKTVAYSKRVNGVQKRYYKNGEAFSHLIGYNSYIYGKTGLELKYNDALQGRTFYYDFIGSIFRNLAQTFQGEKRGSDLFITIDADLQNKAYKLLGNDRGAVVALNPLTGEILAMVSTPAYDPEDIDKEFKTYKEDVDANPLLNRAIMGFYPPGSTFKIITAASALENLKTMDNQKFKCTGKLKIGNYVLSDFNNEVHGAIDLERAFEESCNFTFGTLGMQLGYNNLNKTAEKFLFNREIKTDDFQIGKSQYQIEDKNSKALLAQSAIGQHGVATNPLHMALIAATVANNGVMMKPYVVKEIKDNFGVALKINSPDEIGRAIDVNIAEKIKKYMLEVVEEGTGKRARVYGINVAGKTGTAEIPKTTDTHSWFVGFAPAENPKIAFAVIVENGGTGGKRAAEIAREIIREYLK
ncbi:Penicillin-binding protein A [Caloramator mitchellensis]|uniref:Penicillin-binding protein A n=1 Tax=Caloramator mitchellensis TaxID=908809 RepID=A0A0R3K2B5_CALMK|nr:penicillin-binding transpeptidase domain-containing protein [Caloramator mitchellensis]KRQ87109.1 Penicillin-binding protein A [Caloramator mitchellensis]